MATGSAPMVPMIATTAANTGKKLHGFDFFRAIGSPTRIAAPMVDQSELPFRMLCRAYGAQLCFTPMLHARMAVESKTYLPAHFTTCPGDRPLIAQFCGNDPATLLAAARLVQGSVDAVDLNLGCPQNIARRGRYGSFLLEETALVSRLVATLAEGLDVPVTAKIRLLPTFDATLRLVLALQAAGASMVTVHGRTREQNKERVGAADWATIRALKAHPDVAIPVIANGGIACSADVDACLAATAADGAMSSEALLEDPGLFSRRRRRRRQQPVRGAGGADGVGADAPAPHVAGGAGSPAVAADSFSSDSAPDSAPDSVADSFDLALEYLDLAEALPGADGGCVRAHLMRILFGVWERLPALRQEVVEVRVGGAQALALAAFRDVVLRARAAHREAGPVAAGLPPAAAAPAAACGGAAGAGSLPPRVATAPRAACAGAGGEAGAGGAAVEPAADADAGAAVASGGGGGGGGELGPTTPTAAADAVALSAADSRTARVAAWLAARTADPAVGWAHPAYADDAAAPGRWYMRYRSPRIAAAAGYEGPPKAPRPTQVAATATAAATRVAVAVIPSTSSCAALAASGTADTAGASHVPDGEPALKRARPRSLHACAAALRGSSAGSAQLAGWNAKAVPAACWALGAAGLLPFFYFAAQHDADAAAPPAFDAAARRAVAAAGLPARVASALTVGDQAAVRHAFVAYGACILGFLGGVQWGAAMAAPSAPRRGQYAMAVVPALVGWAACLQDDGRSVNAHFTLAAGFVAAYISDEALMSGHAPRLPSWYTYLRSPLTAAVLLSTLYATVAARDKRVLH